MPFAIRAATGADISEIAATHVQGDEETYRPIFRDGFRARLLAESETRWQDALTGGDVLLVAEDDAEIVGFAHARGAWMSALYLLASHHRQRLGAALLTELCRQVRARGESAIEFQCVADNANAIAFYEAMGARQVGRKTQSEGADTWEDLIFRLGTDAVPAFRGP